MDTVVDIRTKTAGGLLAFADYLGAKGYQGKSGITAWKTAITKVFETTGGEDWINTSLDGIDLDDLARRFQTLTGNTYKAESVVVYKRRVQNAIDAQAFFIENDRPPSFKPQPSKPKAEKPKATEARGLPTDNVLQETKTESVPKLPAQPDFFEFVYPLSPGRIVRMEIPFQMTKREITRLCAVLETLEEQPQLVERNAA